MFREITKENWLLYAQQNYDNPTLQKDLNILKDSFVNIRLLVI